MKTSSTTEYDPTRGYCADYTGIGERMRARRRARRLTQAQLADAMGVSASFVGHLERAEKIPSIETIVRVCRSLDIGADELLFGQKRRCNGNCTLYADLLALMRAHGLK